MYKRFIGIVLSVFFFISASAQIRGVVVDADDGYGVPYASIFLPNLKHSITTDGEGKFELPRHVGNAIVVSCVGYVKQHVTLSRSTDSITVKLKPQSIALEGVTVKSHRKRYSRKNNPAVELMRKVIAHKKETDLSLKPYYSFQKYQKITLSGNQIDTVNHKRKPWFRDQVERSPLDSTKLVLPLMVNEQITKHLYRRDPKRDLDVIEAKRSSGVNKIFQTGDMLNTVLKEVFQDVNINNDYVRLLQYQLNQVFSLPKEYTFLNYLRCHDDIGWGLDYNFLRLFGMGEVSHKKFLNDYLTGKWEGSPSRGELYNDDPRLGDARLCGTTASLCGVEAARYERDETKLAWALRLDISLHAYMFTLSGIPVLYSGDEIALENDYSYHQDPDKAADSRYLHRGNMNWEAAKLRKDPDTPEGKVFLALRRLEQLRNAHRVFDSRADVWLLNTRDNAVLGIGRYYQGEKLLALVNFAETARTVSLDELGEYRDLMTDQAVDKHQLVLEPGGFLWLGCDFETENGKK